MNIIIEQSKIFTSVIGAQSYDNNKIYRLINYCIETEVDNHLLLYNCLTKELLSLSENEKKFLINATFDTDSELIKKLINAWFLVPVDFDDCDFSDQVCNLVKAFNNKREITNYDILTTTDCNARCFYCFECDTIKKNMTKETAIAVAEYIKKKSQKKKIHIQWFGGEPLYNVAVIDIISKHLIDDGINFDSTMTTNGYLFDDEVIKRAKDFWKLRSVQITLDGKRESYNRIKNFIYDGDAYSKVTENIGKLLDNNIGVVIRLNIDKHNSSELFDLVEELAEKYREKKGCMIRPAMLFEDTGKYKFIRSDEERNNLAADVKRLRKRIKELGYSRNSVLLNNAYKTNRCMADSKNSVMILPDGNLGKCEHHLEDKLIGHISMDPEIIAWKEYIPRTETCKTCKVYPTCFKLKDCQSNNSTCYDFEREEIVEAIKEKMEYTYLRKRDREM